MTKRRRARFPAGDPFVYFDEIDRGKIVACDKMRTVSARLIEARESPQGRWHYDADEAQRHIDFIETFCRLPRGRLGAAFVLEPFQRAILAAAFGFVDDDGIRQYREILLIVGRKNGKTSLMSAVQLDLLLNDREGAPAIYNVATKRDQAAIMFDNAHLMVKTSPALKQHVRKRVSDLYAAMNEGTIKALSSEASTLDGLDVHGGFVDELSAIKNRDLYDLVKQGMAARARPMLWAITTNGYQREGIFDAQYEYATRWLDGTLTEADAADRFLPFIYELDDRDEWTNEKAWIKANPGLGTIKSLEALRESVGKAKDDPSYLSTVMVKDFNMKETMSSVWLSWSDIETREPVLRQEGKTRPATFIFEDMEFRYGIGGFDAADSVDLNAAVAICQRRRPNGEIDPRLYVTSMFWLPESVLEADAASGNRKGRDAVPYQLWERQGLLRAAPGNRVDKQVILDWYVELQEEHGLYLYLIGYDPWHIDDSLLARFRAQFGQRVMVPVRQGPRTMSEPLKNLKADLRANLIVHNQNPPLLWNMTNAEVKRDINGNIQLVKGADPRGRIDGLVALANGYIVLNDNRDDYEAMI